MDQLHRELDAFERVEDSRSQELAEAEAAVQVMRKYRQQLHASLDKQRSVTSDLQAAYVQQSVQTDALQADCEKRLKQKAQDDAVRTFAAFKAHFHFESSVKQNEKPSASCTSSQDAQNSQETLQLQLVKKALEDLSGGEKAATGS